MNDTAPLSIAATPPDQATSAPVAAPPPTPGDSPAVPAPIPVETNPELPAPHAALRVSPSPQPSTLNSQLVAQAKGESDRAFEAFRAYLELGPNRRFAAVGKIVGTSRRTIQRWANDFDWRGRIKTCAAQSAEHYLETERDARRQKVLEAAARAKTFRDRRYDLGEAILEAAQRYLEGAEDADLDHMNFGDACKALAAASRLGERADQGETDEPAGPRRTLNDQITALLDKIYGGAKPGNGAGGQPSPAIPTQPQP